MDAGQPHKCATLTDGTHMGSLHRGAGRKQARSAGRAVLLPGFTRPSIDRGVTLDSLRNQPCNVLRVHTLGRLHVRGPDGPVSGSAAQPRRLAILALLAAAGEQGLTREKVMAYLWPEAEEERARRSLNQAIYALRQDLGSEDVVAHAPAPAPPGTGARDLVLAWSGAERPLAVLDVPRLLELSTPRLEGSTP